VLVLCLRHVARISTVNLQLRTETLARTEGGEERWGPRTTDILGQAGQIELLVQRSRDEISAARPHLCRVAPFPRQRHSIRGHFVTSDETTSPIVSSLAPSSGQGALPTSSTTDD
jgi:hypothetical protein